MKKNKKIIIYIITVIISNLLSFCLGIFYYQNKSIKFLKSVNNQTTIIENRKIWGKPDKIDYNENEIIETYYPILPVNEYKFFFNKKDSILTEKWKEY